MEITRNRDTIRRHLEKMMAEWKQQGSFGKEAIIHPRDGGSVVAFRR
jgi:hypothetical protein